RARAAHPRAALRLRGRAVDARGDRPRARPDARARPPARGPGPLAARRAARARRARGVSTKRCLTPSRCQTPLRPRLRAGLLPGAVVRDRPRVLLGLHRHEARVHETHVDDTVPRFALWHGPRETPVLADRRVAAAAYRAVCPAAQHHEGCVPRRGRSRPAHDTPDRDADPARHDLRRYADAVPDRPGAVALDERHLAAAGGRLVPRLEHEVPAQAERDALAAAVREARREARAVA